MKRKILRKTRIVTILSALVVFLTVYSLVLPAVALTDDKAGEDPGINTSETTNVAEVEKLSLNEETSSDVEIETTEQAEKEIQEEEIKEEKTVIENVSYPAVSFSDSLGDMIVYVEAPEGAFPENTQMQLKEVEDEAALVDSINSNLENKEVKAIKAVDITFIYNNEEFEPLKPIKVSMTSSFIESNKEDEQLLVHVDNDNNTNIVETTEVKEKDVEVINNVEEVQALVENTDEINEITTDNTVAFESDAFSVYAVVYTVDFEYSLNGVVYTYNLAGGDSISLADLAEALNIIEGTQLENVDAFVEQVVNVSFSDENLVEVVNEDGEWILYSLKPFTSQESLIITMKNGDVITINVTDAQYVTEMNGLITSASLKLNGVEVEDGATIEARENTIFDLSVNFAENDDFQFSNDGVLTYKLPDGFVLTDSIETYVTIDLGIDGKLYRNKLTYDNNTNTVTLNLNKDDPNYGAFTASGTALINLQLNGHFDFTKSHVEFSPDLSVDVNRKDPHDANVNKTGSYDKETQTMTYRVTVTADGTVTDLNVSDHISGSALTYQSGSIRVVEDQRPASAGERTNQITWNEADGGFDALIPDMVDGEVIVFEYKASVDPEKVSQSGNATFEEMGNTVKIHNDTVDKEATNVYHNIEVSNISKEALSVSEVIEEGDKKYQNVTWEIITNDPPTVSLAGSTITDTITGAMVSNTIYNDDITIRVFDSNGNEISGSPRTPSLSSLGVTDPQNQKSWTYTVLESDGNYKYVIHYSTKVDVTYVTGTSTAMNNVDGKGGNDTGTAPVGQNKGDPSGGDEPDDGISVSKQTLHVSESEVQWVIPISVEAKEGGYSSFVVTDHFPNRATGEQGFIDQLKVTDETVLENNISVSGLHDGEYYKVEYLPPITNKVYEDSGKSNIPSGIKVTFYKADGTPGLMAESSRVLTLRLTTLNDPDWLDYALNSTDPEWNKHTNSGDVNNEHNFSYTAQPMKRVINKVLHGSQPINYTYPGHDQPISVPRYEFRISVGGVNEEPLQIQDTFNSDLFMLLPDSVPVVAGGSHKTDPGNAKRNLVEGTDYSTVGGGINFDITDLPKDNGSYYGYYIITYYLIPKSDEALSQIKMLAADNNGTAVFENTAALDDENKSTAEFDYKYKILDKTAMIKSGGYVDYTITINPDKMTLNNGEIMTLTDKYSKNQTIDFSTITVNTDPVEKKTDVSWDFSGYLGQFKIPDETKVIITYSAKPSESGEQTLTNEVYMNGYSDDSGESKVVSGDGGGSAGSLRIRLFKYESGHMEAGLNGAIFRLLDANKQPVKDRNGDNIEFSTSEVYMYIADVPETDQFITMGIAGKKKDAIETSQQIIAQIEANPWLIGTYVKKVSGYANVLVNEDTTGAYLKKDTRYYLEEIQTAATDPQGNPASYKYPTFLYSFMISDHPDYSQYIYSNNDVMTARNDRDNGGLDIVKLWGGSAELTVEQKNKIYFLIETKIDDNWIPYTHDGKYPEGKIHYSELVDDVVHLEDVPVGSYRVTEYDASIDAYKLVTTYTVDGHDTEASTEFAFIDDDVDATPKTHNVTITNKYDVKGYEFTKIDSNTLQSLSDAEFTVKKQLDDSSVKVYTSGTDGKFVIDNSEGKFEKDVLYYVEETKAPEGYTITDNSKYYFYFADSVNAKWDKTYNAINLTTDGGRQTVGNEKGELSVTKNWVNAGNKPKSVSMTLKRYTMVDPVKSVSVTLTDANKTGNANVANGSSVTVSWQDSWWMWNNGNIPQTISVNGETVSKDGQSLYRWYNNGQDCYLVISAVTDDLDIQLTGGGGSGELSFESSGSDTDSDDSLVRKEDSSFAEKFSLSEDIGWNKKWKISDVATGDDVLPKHDNKGNIYYYYVEEETLADFEVSYEPAQGTGLNVGEIIVTNTGNEPEKGSVKVTKTFSGIESLPDGFKIINNINETEFTVANKDGGEGTSDDPYYWVIEDLDIGEEVQFTESGYRQDGYSVLINGKATASPETAIAASELSGSAVVGFVNTYEELKGSLQIDKSVTINGNTINDNTPADLKNLADGTYVFTVLDSEGNPAEGKLNDAALVDGRVEIVISNGVSKSAVITDLKPGNYYITEENPTNGTALSKVNETPITSDSTPEDKTAVINVEAGTSTEIPVASFENNYEFGYLKINKTVTYNGENPSNDKEIESLVGTYVFGIFTDEQCNSPYMVNNDPLTVTVEITNDGSSKDSEVILLPVGEYWIKENDPSDPSILPIHNNIKVEVTREDTSGTPASADFINNKDVSNNPDEYAIELEKTFNGLQSLSDIPNNFSVVLSYTIPSSDGPKQEDIVLTGKSEGHIHFSKKENNDFIWHWRITHIPSTATDFRISETGYDIEGYSRSTTINGEQVNEPDTPQSVDVYQPEIKTENTTSQYQTTDNQKVFTVKDNQILLVRLTSHATVVVSQNSLGIATRSAIEDYLKEHGYKIPDDDSPNAQWDSNIVYFSHEIQGNKFSYGGRTIYFEGDTVKVPHNASSHEVRTDIVYKSESAENSYVIENSYSGNSIDLDVLKVEIDKEESSKLAGAEFELRTLEDIEPTESGTLTYVVNPDGQVVVVSKATGTNGKLTFDSLDSGIYEIREVTPPAGYVLTDEIFIYFKVTSGQVSYIQKGSGKPSSWSEKTGDQIIHFVPKQESNNAYFRIANTPGTELPHTGGVGNGMIKLLGTTVMLASIAVFLERKKRK